jgi:hypothetical protein
MTTHAVASGATAATALTSSGPPVLRERVARPPGAPFADPSQIVPGQALTRHKLFPDRR